MNKQHPSNHFLHKFGGYYLIPHELLHVLAYRLIGKQCHYEWGDYRVRGLAKRTRPERLLVLLLPFVVCWVFALFFSFLWILSAFFIKMSPQRYFIDGPTWHFVFPIIASLFVLYSGTAYRDVRVVLRMLSGKDKS